VLGLAAQDAVTRTVAAIAVTVPAIRLNRVDVRFMYLCLSLDALDVREEPVQEKSITG
jgi:hypothetical protein